MRALVVLSALISASVAVYDTPFLQLTATRYNYAGLTFANWPQLPMANSVLHMASDSQALNAAWLITDSQLWYYTIGGQATAVQGITITNHSRIAECEGRLAITTRDGVYRCQRTETNATVKPVETVIKRGKTHYRASIVEEQSVGASCEFLPSHDVGDVKAVVLLSTGDVWFGGTHGLFLLPNGTDTILPHINVTEEVFSMVLQESTNILWVGTHHRMFWLDLDTEVVGFIWTLSVFGRTPRAMAFDDQDTLWVGSYAEVCRMFTNGTVLQTYGEDGLPYDHITSMAAWPDTMYGGTRMWMGTKRGTVIHDADGTWHFYQGLRWAPGDYIHAVTITTDGTIILATDAGMSELVYTTQTMSQKADVYQAIIEARHIRRGITAPVGLNTPGVLSSWSTQLTSNGGLWTGMYAASQAFRYAATGDPDARDNAWGAFEGLELLFNLTGIPGYPARNFCPITWDIGPGWVPSPTNSSLHYWSNTSSDEITGHMFAMGVVGALVADSEANRSRVYGLMDQLMGRIVTDNLRLIQQDGTVTQWGRWWPALINGDPQFRDQAGVNSLEILSFLQAVYAATGNKTYIDVYQSLVDDHNYAENVINARLIFPEKVSYSDDNLIFASFYLYHLATNGDVPEEVLQGLDNAMAILKKERSPLWNYIYATMRPNDTTEGVLEFAAYTLREWPMEWIQWPVNNTYRLNKPLNPLWERMGDYDSMDVIPYDEQPFCRWNADPFTLSAEGSTQEECDPTGWLLPYWMGRYYGYIEAST